MTYNQDDKASAVTVYEEGENTYQDKEMLVNQKE